MNEMKDSSKEFHPASQRSTGCSSASAKRRFVKLGRKTSDGSQSAVSNASACGSAEGAAGRQPGKQPSKSRIRRHTNHLSGLFLRGPAAGSGSMSQTTGLRSSRSAQARKGSMVCAGAPPADDPSELSNQRTAPGILKIFGNEICEGAHYKSVLASTHSSAKELVKEALERYGLSKEEAESYILCDTIGSIDKHQWRTEGFRVVGDHEKPLLLQSLWKPREGLVRRFEIQRRRLIEEKISGEKDTITAGINAQARKLQKSRSRVTSTIFERTAGRSQKLWRSKSEMDLLDSEAKRDPHAEDQHESLGPVSVPGYDSLKMSPEKDGIHGTAVPSEGDGGSQAKTETLCVPRPRAEREGEESEREETESSDDNTTQYSIHPPHDCPYLLLLQGCSLAQDFVIYLLAAPHVVVGQQSAHEDKVKTDIPLFAGDILPKHCSFQRHAVGGPIVLRPCPDAVVTRNGDVLKSATRLSPGDLIGMGKHYLFLFRDPLIWTHKEPNSSASELYLSAAVPWIMSHSPSAATPNHTTEAILCNSCISSCTDHQSSACDRPPNRSPPILKSPGGHSLTLGYQAEDEDRLVREIVAAGGGGSVPDRPPLTVSFLLSLCVQYSASCLRTSDLRRLLLLIASGVQSAMWDCTTELAGVQSEARLEAGSLHEMTSGLRPLVVWMANSLELLQFLQHQLPLLLEWRNQEELNEEWEAPLERRLSCVRSACEETTAVLEEVILLAFQQCVYYITKLLHPVLPGLLDCNPFRESPDLWLSGDRGQVPGSDGLRVTGEIWQVVEVLNESWRLLLDCQVHREVSSQLIGYLFYFVNASLFNSLMERGSEPGFYQWFRGVQMRASLDLVLDWGHAAGLGELALEHTHTLSSAINLLATPRKNLLQTSWASLRAEYPALSPAQLNHLLSLYSPASPCTHMWTPSAQDQAATHQTADILESFDTHHPLVLPDEGYRFQLRGTVADSALRDQLHKLKEFIASPSEYHLNTNGAGTDGGGAIETETTQTAVNILESPSLESSKTPADELDESFQVSPPSPSSAHRDKLSYDSVHILAQKLISLETGSRELERAAMEPTLLLTPPDTPHTVDPGELVEADGEAAPPSSTADNGGGLVFECLAALKSGGGRAARLMELKEEEEDGVEEERVDDEVFSLELERGEGGLGLSLEETRSPSAKAKGVFIRAVVPDSPAARCEKLEPGDRILAVNGASLLGLDHERGKELIRSSGARLRLLVARSPCTAAAAHPVC
ncbi:ras-associating and dilute domain-containing protein isoform X2 [Kryptolebias marmoratus]|uniref:ras-associating and dilute domain-containing protein isoform X2 n=1 Tax=Kryptolebias marmoratus TaxID=37003 RepID=UPI0007F908A6|nr:ras-associating and dilute domain-containing protein isoform X2 [Kryptolebias marmoratus]